VGLRIEVEFGCANPHINWVFLNQRSTATIIKKASMKKRQKRTWRNMSSVLVWIDRLESSLSWMIMILVFDYCSKVSGYNIDGSFPLFRRQCTLAHCIFYFLRIWLALCPRFSEQFRCSANIRPENHRLILLPILPISISHLTSLEDEISLNSQVSFLPFNSYD